MYHTNFRDFFKDVNSTSVGGLCKFSCRIIARSKLHLTLPNFENQNSWKHTLSSKYYFYDTSLAAGSLNDCQRYWTCMETNYLNL